MSDDIWSAKSVYLTSFWGWTPETWGTVGFTAPGRRDTIVRQTTDPFIVVVYVTKSARKADPDILGKITGFYVVSHIEGHRDAFTHPIHHPRDRNKWQYSLKALRAFSFLPEYRISIDQFDPTLGPRARSVAANGEEISGDQIKRLKQIPFVEMPVFGQVDFIIGDIHLPARNGHKTKAGPVNRAGYMVAGEPLDTEKELYALVLQGDTSSFLGEPAAGCRIFKIGLSMSPKTRLEAFQKTLPDGAFKWEMHRSTRQDEHAPYASFYEAEAGENAMKDYLGQNATWLGGEFYLTKLDLLQRAWKVGREAALAYGAAHPPPAVYTIASVASRVPE